MAFWDRWKKPKELAPGESDGKLRGGNKHGVWRERAAKPTTKWNGKEFVPVDYDLEELTYVDGAKTGPYTIYWGSGGKREQGTYLDGKRDGAVQIWNRDGAVRGEGTFRNGELHGHWRAHHYETGAFHYEGDYIDGKRHGAWKSGHDNGQLEEQGAHVEGKRDGDWIFWSKAGVETMRGRYALDKRVGVWTLRRDDGSLRATGEYRDGVPTGTWKLVAPNGSKRERECFEEEDLARWEELETSVELLADYAPTEAWIARAKGALTDLGQPWRVEANRDKFGQTWLSAPIDSFWQLRVAAGVPLHEVCRDECWSKLLDVIDKWPAERVSAAVATAERAGRLPSYAPRDWLTRILEGEADDPRNRLVSRFEPGRNFTPEMMERFRTRVPHLEGLSLRECYFEHGLVPLFERGYPELERLMIVRSETREGDVRALVKLLARATWVGKLVQLAIVESGDQLADGDVAALLANEHMAALKYLTLDNVKLGPASARAFAKRAALETLDMRDSTLDAAALAAIAALPNLEELRLRRCELPALTSRQAAAIGPSAKLRSLELAGTLGIERYSGERTPYGVARRLALMPALASVEELDLSDNELDELAARVLARSPHLGRIRELDWTGNDDADGDLAELRAALPNAKLATSTRRGNVVVMQL
jgi:antitoxin component YwqK of YwqJK toxin-antitoxin module